MPDGLEVRIPRIDDVLLIGRTGVAVIHVDEGRRRRRHARHLHPRLELPGAAHVFLYLMAQLRRAIRRGEKNVVAGRLSLAL